MLVCSFHVVDLIAFVDEMAVVCDRMDTTFRYMCI